MKIPGFVIFALSLTLFSCGDNDLKGHLKLDITDSPADADQVKGVNIYVTLVDAKVNGEWKSLHRFEQSIGINLLEFSGQNSFNLIDQDIDPGTITELKFSLNLADFNSGLVRNPQCNIAFENGTTTPLYFSEELGTDVIVSQTIDVKTRSRTAYTFDFDVRKSLLKNSDGKYVFKPVIRTIETAKAGHINGTVTNSTIGDRVVVYTYAPGTFASSETAEPETGEVRFKNAINSARIKSGKFSLGFLPEGNYDLIFVKHSETGEFISVMGHKSATITAEEALELSVDMNTLTGS